jgi:hypothetical protein
MPLIIGTADPLPPPPIGTDEGASAPGIPQPVIVTGGQSLPPSFPLPPAGTWIPPPLIGEGANAPAPTPVVPPGTGIGGPTQPQFVPPGSATVPTAASLFPDGTTTPPYPPIVFANIFKIGTVPPPLPSTPGQTPPPIVFSPVPTIPQLPWNPPPTQPPPVNTVRPVVTVVTNLQVGSTLSSSTGTWTNAATYARAWTHNGSPIAGATATTYTLVTADLDAMIAVNITATGPGGEASMDSLPVGPVIEPPLDEGATLPSRRDDPPPASRAAPTHHRAPSKKKR